MAHGGGGKRMHELLERVFLRAFDDPRLAVGHDASEITAGGSRLAFTTDSYVVRPLFFPGGDIGTLAVNGTVNDLAMAGARPLYLSAGFILEEGFPLADLERIVASMRDAARKSGVAIVTGDTKVVDRGKGDGLYLNTSGIGLIEGCWDIRPQKTQPGDAVLVSGDLGRHGIAILSAREGLEFETDLQSDCAPLWPQVEKLLSAGTAVHCLRDLTRGGLSSALNEIAGSRGLEIRIDEASVPVVPQVRSACELLGLDPLYVANEGRFLACVSAADEEKALELLGSQAAIIGHIGSAGPGRVLAANPFGTERLLDMLSGEQLPRIC